jgi:hypothetical protein
MMSSSHLYRPLSWQVRAVTLVIAIGLSFYVVETWAFGMKFAKLMADIERRAVESDAAIVAAAAHPPAPITEPGVVMVGILGPQKPKPSSPKH